MTLSSHLGTTLIGFVIFLPNYFITKYYFSLFKSIFAFIKNEWCITISLKTLKYKCPDFLLKILLFTLKSERKGKKEVNLNAADLYLF